MIYLPVFRDRFALATPARTSPPGESCELWDLLSREFDTDAHFAAYQSIGGQRLARVDIGSRQIEMRALVVDVDAPDKSASSAWRRAAESACAKLGGQPFGYHTRGGLRLVWRLVEPSIIETENDARAWSREYVRCLVSISSAQITPDPSTRDFTRLFRAPHTLRDGSPQRLGWACGDPAAVGLWPETRAPDSALRAAAARLATTGEAWRQAYASAFLEPAQPRAEPVLKASHRGGNAALKLACDRIRETGKGSRNWRLFVESKWIGKIVRQGDVGDAEARGALGMAALEVGLEPGEIDRTIASGFRASPVY